MNIPVQPGIELFLLFLLLFAIFWCGIMAFISFIGGWHELAKSFPAEENIFRITSRNEGERFRCASMTMGPKYFPTNYGNCLTIDVSREGIGIRIWPVFRFLHPPLLIPWLQVEGCVRENFLLIFTRTALSLNTQRHALRFSGRAGKAIFEEWLQRVGGSSIDTQATS